MTSSQHFASSPTSPTRQRIRRSKFTYKHLSTLAHSATNCPLRAIAHIDLDAFYAQCEMVRLGVEPDQPLAVQQWQGLIAINYPARAYGLSRHVTINEAKEKCPDIICQHVATWKEGDAKWSYSDDAWKEIATRKVSLDPYRIESRRILAIIKATLPADLQRVEKASVDEVFVDLSAQVHALLLERYPELNGPAPYDDPSEPLPRPPTTALDWAADALVDLDSSQSEEDDPDWDDVSLLIASEIVRDIRARIYRELKYTCSAGLSRNKMLAKLGSGHKKPNSQTVIRNRAVQHFLSGFKFTKIRNLGGKLGDEVVAAFNTDTVADLLPVPIEQLKKRLGDDTGSWLYSIIRGEDQSEVNPRTQIKSMLSAKSFRPSINTFEVACKWLRIFVADIFGRLVEEGVLENRRRPKTINIHHRQGAQTRSRQAPIPTGKSITEDGLFELAKNLLAQVIVDGRAWPCANLSLSVGGFEDGPVGNRGIGGFLLRGEEAKALQTSTNTSSSKDTHTSSAYPPSKKRRLADPAGITRFFGRQPSADDDEHDSPHPDDPDTRLPFPPSPPIDPFRPPTSGQILESQHLPSPPTPIPRSPPLPSSPSATANPSATFLCPRCTHSIPLTDQQEHSDFHFAQDLQNASGSQDAAAPSHPSSSTLPTQPSTSSSASPSAPHPTAKTRSRGRPPATALFSASAPAVPEKGQKRLAFG